MSERDDPPAAVFDADRPLRVGALFSGGASAVRYLLDSDPDCNTAYELVVGVGDRSDPPGAAGLRASGVPVETNDFGAFCAQRDADPGDTAVRTDYDAVTRRTLAEYDPDVLVLSGYMRLVTGPLLDAYPIVNVHPADLTVEDGTGDRAYTGTDAVYDAITAGEDATRSTVHFVTAGVDAGPVLVRSAACPVHRDLVDPLLDRGNDDAVRSYADAHQAWMKRVADGPAVAAALSLIAGGRVGRDGDTVSVDGRGGFFQLSGGATGGGPEPDGSVLTRDG